MLEDGFSAHYLKKTIIISSTPKCPLLSFFVPLTAAHVMAKSCDGTAAAQVTRRSKVCVCV